MASASSWEVAKRVKTRLREDRLSIVAAGVAFYALMAVFPALIALVGLYGLAFDPQQVARQAAAFSAMLPPEAAAVVLGQLHDLVQTDRNALGFGALAGLLLALWSASAGVRTLMEALNIAWHEEERRGFFRFYATALLLTLSAIVGVMLAIGMVVALPVVIRFLGLTTLLEGVLSLARWPILVGMMLAGLAIVYRFGPCRAAPRQTWLSPGAVFATGLWVLGSALFSLYVAQFGNYNETYGSVGAVVILLMWFLLSSYAVLIGAEIDAELAAMG